MSFHIKKFLKSKLFQQFSLQTVFVYISFSVCFDLVFCKQKNWEAKQRVLPVLCVCLLRSWDVEKYSVFLCEETSTSLGKLVKLLVSGRIEFLQNWLYKEDLRYFEVHEPIFEIGLNRFKDFCRHKNRFCFVVVCGKCINFFVYLKKWLVHRDLINKVRRCLWLQLKGSLVNCDWKTVFLVVFNSGSKLGKC